MCKNWNVLNFKCAENGMCSLKSFTYVPQCEAQEEELIKSFILNTNHKLNTIPPHTQRARLGAIGTHVSEMKKNHIHMSHSVEHRRRRECVIRELLIADSDRRLRLSSSIQEYSQSKESYYIPTYISRYYSVLPISDHVLRKRGKRLIHTWVHRQFQAGPYLDLQHICLLTNIDFLVAAQLWSTLLYSINCGFLKSHDNLGNVETKSSKIIALAGENFDLKTFKIILG